MASVSVAMHRDPSSSSNCSSERIAPYACSRLYTESPVSTLSPLESHLKIQPIFSKAVLDEAAKSRLIQLYTTRKPISSAKKIQSHFTCLYLTGSNIHHVLESRSRPNSRGSHDGANYLSTSPLYSSRFADLGKLIQQSWRVTFGTLDYLELIWTGHRPSKSWSEILASSTHSESGASTTSGPGPRYVDEDEFLALNVAVTYYYTPEGQPTLSLAAIAITKEAFNAINIHVASVSQLQSQSRAPSLPHGPASFLNLRSPLRVQTSAFTPLAFDQVPFVHRDILVPTLCRWRNADIQIILTMAAEGRAWSSKLLSEGSDDSTDVELPGACVFPTVRSQTSSASRITNTTTNSEYPLSSSTSSSATTSPAPSLDGYELETLNGEMSTSKQNSPALDDPPTIMEHPSLNLCATSDTTNSYSLQQQELPPIYELRAALAPGRDTVFRTMASRLSGVLDREWIRRSSQLPIDCGNGSAKRRREA